jgi:DNA-binding winged helix-turn-helix (wHTH) protein/TolB-like protein
MTVTGWQIGEWRVEPSVNEIGRDGEAVRIEPKVMEVLAFLADRAGQVVSREELLSAVWPGAVVGDDTLSQAIIKLRKALRDPAKSPQYIETIPKRGYRLVAPATRVELDRARETVAQPQPVLPSPAPGRHRRGRRLALIGAAAAALIVGGISLYAFVYRGDATPDIPSIEDLIVDRSAMLPTVAVTPFETHADDAEHAYLARGIAADLTTDMSGISGLRMISVSTPGEPPPVRYLVSGSLHRTAAGLRINVRLADTSSGQVLWAERYERPARDLVMVEEEIVGRLMSVLPVKISESEKRRIARRYTRHPEAYDYFLRGRAAYLARTPADNETAKAMYRQSIERDPAFARAYAGLAFTYTADYRNQWTADGQHAIAKAVELANTALQMDPQLAEIYVVLGYVSAVQRQHAQAIKYLHRAIALDRSYADAYAFLAAVYTNAGEPERTVPLMRMAMRLNADAGFIYFLVLGRAYFFQGDLEQASINLREALARNPADLETRIYTAANLIAAGKLEDAHWEAAEIRHLQAGFATQTWLQTSPMTDPDMKNKLIGVMKQVGL